MVRIVRIVWNNDIFMNISTDAIFMVWSMTSYTRIDWLRMGLIHSRIIFAGLSIFMACTNHLYCELSVPKLTISIRSQWPDSGETCIIQGVQRFECLQQRSNWNLKACGQKWILPNFGCKVGQSNPIAMQFRVAYGANYHIYIYIYISLQIDIARHDVEKYPNSLENVLNIVKKNENEIFM